MFKLVTIFVFFCSCLFANTLHIDIDTLVNTTLNTKQNQIVIEDKEDIFTSIDILQNHFKSNYHKSNVSYTQSTFWTKTHIKNISNKPILLLFRNNRASVDYIDVNIFDTNNNLIKEQKLGDLRTQTDRVIIGTKSVFHQRIEPNQELIVISKFSSLGAMDLYWDILDVNYYSYVSTVEYIFWGLFGGVILIILIYNLFMFFALKEKVFIFYLLHGLSVLCMTYALNGIFYVLDLGIDLHIISLSTWFIPPLMLLFLNLFSFSFFKITKKNKISYSVFFVFISIYLIWFFVFLYGFIDESTLHSGKYFVYVMLCNMFFLFGLAIGYIKKGFSGAIFFLIGETIYLVSLLYVALLVLGLLESNYLSFFIMPTALMIEIICFIFALSRQIYQLKKENERQELLLLHSKNTEDISKALKNLSHQVRQPLSYISSQFVYLETLYNVGQKDKIVDEFISIKDNLNYAIENMSHLITVFNDFYSSNNTITDIKVKYEIDSLLSINHQRLIKMGINVKVECDEDIKLTIYKSYFTNIIGILLGNSLEYFEAHNITNPTIYIRIFQNDIHTILEFEDNSEALKNKIFESSLTRKNSHNGLGLNILKLLIEEKLKGKIKVYDKDNKTIFTIELSNNYLPSL
jgi:two-component system, sensor histidine kinase LadS